MTVEDSLCGHGCVCGHVTSIQDDFVFSDDHEETKLLLPGDGHDRIIVVKIQQILSMEHGGLWMGWLEVCLTKQVC